MDQNLGSNLKPLCSIFHRHSNITKYLLSVPIHGQMENESERILETVVPARGLQENQIFSAPVFSLSLK